MSDTNSHSGGLAGKERTYVAEANFPYPSAADVEQECKRLELLYRFLAGQRERQHSTVVDLMFYVASRELVHARQLLSAMSDAFEFSETKSLTNLAGRYTSVKETARAAKVKAETFRDLRDGAVLLSAMSRRYVPTSLQKFETFLGELRAEADMERQTVKTYRNWINYSYPIHGGMMVRNAYAVSLAQAEERIGNLEPIERQANVVAALWKRASAEYHQDGLPSFEQAVHAWIDFEWAEQEEESWRVALRTQARVNLAKMMYQWWAAMPTADYDVMAQRVVKLSDSQETLPGGWTWGMGRWNFSGNKDTDITLNTTTDGQVGVPSRWHGDVKFEFYPPDFLYPMSIGQTIDGMRINAPVLETSMTHCYLIDDVSLPRDSTEPLKVKGELVVNQDDHYPVADSLSLARLVVEEANLLASLHHSMGAHITQAVFDALAGQYVTYGAHEGEHGDG